MRLPRYRFELDLGAQWSFPLDGPPSTPLGELALGFRWSRYLGVGLRFGVAEPWSARRDDATVLARRLPLAAELRVHIPVWRGGVRFYVGPQLAFWLAESEHVGHPGADTLFIPGAELRVVYRFEYKRLAVEAGVHGDLAFVVDQLGVAGLGTVSRTPRADLGPALAVGLRL